MSNYLKSLTELAAPDLIEFDRDSLVQEIIDRIKSNPEWDSIYDGELLQNFLYSIINTFAFLFSKNSETVNRLIRETFITQAKDTQSIANHLARFGINFKQNTTSVVPITVSNSNGGGFSRSFVLPSGYQVLGSNLNGVQTTFEFYNKDADDSSKYDYRSSIVIPATGQEIINAYSGTTYRYDFTINPVSQREKFIYKIQIPDIIEGSIRGYYEFNQSNERELISTSSFVVSAVDADVNFPGGTPHYKIKYNADGSADLIFGTESFGGSFPSAFSSNITFFCRAGGGSLTNVAPGAISTTDIITISSGNQVNVLFRNLTSGSGGSDRENINEAKFYSPYRTGRDGALVDDTDIINELVSRTVKHLVDSPKYADISTQQKIPILHYWNYIAPKRDFNSFQFPTPVESDTITTYSVKLEAALNEFLNLQGIHDGVESNKLISLFSEGPISYNIPKTPVLNGTIVVSAFGENNVEKDRLIFSGNYSGTANAPTDYTSYAEIATTNPITTAVTVISGNNDQLKFKIDESTPGPAPSSTSFTITISEGVYGLTLGKSIALAAEIDAKIKAAFPLYYGSFEDEICYIRSDGRLAIRSRITGQYSSVKIFTVGAGIETTIGLVPAYAYALPENGRVLLSSSTFDDDNSKLNININTTKFNRNFNISPEVQWPASNSDVGPTLEYVLLDENDNTYLTQEGTTLTVESYNGSTLTDTLTFSNIASDSPNVGSGNPVGSVAVFDDSTPTSCVFDFATNKLTLKLVNSNDAGPSYSFPKYLDVLGTPEVYNESTTFKIYTKEKTFKFIAISYEPNPYFNETEAAEVLSVLKAKGKRSLALEPLVKKVEFIPLKIEVNAHPAKGVSGEETIANSETVLYNAFEYSNTDSRNNISTGFSKTRAESILNDKTANRGIDYATIITPSDTITDSVGNKYYFILPQDFISRIEALEDEFANIVGLSDSYKVKINIV